MLYICKFSNKFDLIQAIRVSHVPLSVSQIPFILRGDEKNPHFCILDKKLNNFKIIIWTKKIITKLQILNIQQFQIKAHVFKSIIEVCLNNPGWW